MRVFWNKKYRPQGQALKSRVKLLEKRLLKIYYEIMIQSQKIQCLIEEFIDSDTVKAVADFSESQECNKNSVDLIGKMFGYAKDFSDLNNDDEKKLIVSFKNNLQLLIQKTWVEKSDIALKEQILYHLENLCSDDIDWGKTYSDFLEIIDNAVYLMFGQQTKSDDFCEYSLRIDPGFGIFWWFIKSLPPKAEWPLDKCRNSVLLGMYFLANY